MIGFSRGKTPWVDLACADRPGSLVPRAAGPAAPSFVQDAQLVAPWTFACICCPLRRCFAPRSVRNLQGQF